MQSALFFSFYEESEWIHGGTLKPARNLSVILRIDDRLQKILISFLLK